MKSGATTLRNTWKRFSPLSHLPINAGGNSDKLLLFVAISLAAFGLVMVYSASIALPEAGRFTGYQPAYYLLRHGIFIAVGLFVGLLAFQVPVQLV
mgnify:CR=1 FL=1